MTSRHAISGSSLSKCFETVNGLGKVTERFWALKNVSFDVLEGETLCILGESGSGKSTLAKILVGADQQTEGLLIIDGKDVGNLTEVKQQQRNRHVRMVFQDTLGSLNPSLTLGEILLEPLLNMTGLDKQERQDQVRKVLDLVGLKWEYSSRLPHTFSAGERQRIAIARALILDPVCIIADEPLSSLETSAQSQILNLMLDLQKNLGISFIIITYNIDIIKHMCDKVLVLCRGRTVEYGPTLEVINNPQHPYTKDFLNPGQNPARKQLGEAIDASITGCVYCDRCELLTELCQNESPLESLTENRLVHCHRFDRLEGMKQV